MTIQLNWCNSGSLDKKSPSRMFTAFFIKHIYLGFVKHMQANLALIVLSLALGDSAPNVYVAAECRA
jgi:hypothetical protein